MKKPDHERLKKILNTWQALREQIDARGITCEMVLTDAFTQWAITTPLYNIGEQVYHLSDDLKKRTPDIPWSAVSGIRHRLVHDYEGINWTLLVDVLFDEMPGFIEAVGNILQKMEQDLPEK